MKKIKSFLNYLSVHIYEAFLSVIGLLNILPILAPIFAKIGLILPAKVIYWVYSFFCHQLHWRSFHICDYQNGWCSRCTFMWFNILLSGLAVKFLKLKNLKWYWVLVLILPMALDGGIQTVMTLIGFGPFRSIDYMSTNFMRMLTGSIFGLGFGLWIFSNLKETVNLENKVKMKEGRPFNVFYFILISIGLSVLVYILMVFIWDATSTKYKPENFLDLSVKTPVHTEDFLIRSKNTP